MAFDEDFQIFGSPVWGSDSDSDFHCSVQDCSTSASCSSSYGSDEEAISFRSDEMSQQQLKKKSKGDPIMSSDEWRIGVKFSLAAIKNMFPTVISLNHFNVESSTRYSVKNPALNLFKIFPWFHAGLAKFRQTLKTSLAQGPTIERVLEAINYFYQRRGEVYTEAEMGFLEEYYLTMKIPVPSLCLSTVIDVYLVFRDFRESKSNEKTVPEPVVTLDQFQGLERRVQTLEGIEQRTCASESQPPGAKKSRYGGDRACWYPIRRCDLDSRSEWCVPGGVFGLYADGVGRLLPIDACARRSIVVHSTDPDTVEAHPAPENPDHVLVVMVSHSLFLASPCLSDRPSLSLRLARLP
jgi:hypothetical protein